MKIDQSKLEEFIEEARSIVGREGHTPFSLEDLYHLASKFKLIGAIYLEKFDDKRHVNVLLDLGEDSMTLYDPLLGVKIKPFDEIQFGIYCQPLGTLKDEFEKYLQQLRTNECRDVWSQYRQRGKLLFRFIKQHSEFRSIYAGDSISIADFPTLQNNSSYSDCAPISLFIMSLYNSVMSHP